MVFGLICCLVVSFVSAAESIAFKEGDVVAFAGGGDVAAAQRTGHIESLLAVSFPNVRFRNFGWEGDTVFEQPRDYKFPPLIDHLRRAKTTVIVVQYGRTEALSDMRTGDFQTAYRRLIADFRQVTPRILLVTPVPFEKPEKPLPDLSARNEKLKRVSEAIRKIGREEQLPIIDLFSALNGKIGRRTDDGLQLTAYGHAMVADAFVTELGLGANVRKAGEPDLNGAWKDARFEALRAAVIKKNQYWFDYWRPQNWAFLGGDRTEQPSSRDHRDPKVRWFPSEMEKFQPLIMAEEGHIADAAAKVNEN